MSTIPSQLPPIATGALPARHHSRMARSLIDLSASTQPSAPPDSDLDASSSGDSLAAAAQIARQNRISALADPAAAASANQSAVSGIGANPAAALATQATQAPENAWSLLQD